MKVILKPAGLFLVIGAVLILAAMLFLRNQNRKLSEIPETAPIAAFKSKSAVPVSLYDDPSKMPPIDLTESGKVDWIHWASNSVKAAAHKKGGKAFSELTMIAPQAGTIKAGEQGPSRGVLWSDGVAGAEKSAVTYEALHAGPQNGFRFTVSPHDAKKHTLHVYVGGWKTGGTFDALMSDGSKTTITKEGAALPNHYFSDIYTVEFETTAPDRSLNVEWKSAGKNGNISLQAATLE